jgi:poly-gamma-glutamate synthesis protein (capsule biosynthesis protein)
MPKEWFSFLGMQFHADGTPYISTTCDDSDLEEISQWVRDARERADLVLISVHCHEPGSTPEDPPRFFGEFAHRMIDEGADMVVGHGPHYLRGMELYNKKPIFYCLGNVASQIDLAERVAAEDYAKAHDSRAVTPAAYFAARGIQAPMFGYQARFWRTVLPVLTFRDGCLTEASMYPVALGFGRPLVNRGLPRLADGEEATDILRAFAELCAPYDVSVSVVQDSALPTGQIELPKLRTDLNNAAYLRAPISQAAHPASRQPPIAS